MCRVSTLKTTTAAATTETTTTAAAKVVFHHTNKESLHSEVNLNALALIVIFECFWKQRVNQVDS